jgi:hypothetical protein
VSAFKPTAITTKYEGEEINKEKHVIETTLHHLLKTQNL